MAFFWAKIIERHIRILGTKDTKRRTVSIQPKDIKEVIEFSKLSKNDQKIVFKRDRIKLKLT